MSASNFTLCPTCYGTGKMRQFNLPDAGNKRLHVMPELIVDCPTCHGTGQALAEAPTTPANSYILNRSREGLPNEFIEGPMPEATQAPDHRGYCGICDDIMPFPHEHKAAQPPQSHDGALMEILETMQNVRDDHGDIVEYGRSLAEAHAAIIELVGREVVGEDEEAVIGRGVPGYTRNLLRQAQRRRLGEL